MQADSLISGYCFLTDTPAATATTAVAAVTVGPSPPSIAVAAAMRYAYILGNTPERSAITLSQTEFYANKAVGGGGGAIFWDGPVKDLVVICTDVGDVFGKLTKTLLPCCVCCSSNPQTLLKMLIDPSLHCVHVMPGVAGTFPFTWGCCWLHSLTASQISFESTDQTNLFGWGALRLRRSHERNLKGIVYFIIIFSTYSSCWLVSSC